MQFQAAKPTWTEKDLTAVVEKLLRAKAVMEIFKTRLTCDQWLCCTTATTIYYCTSTSTSTSTSTTTTTTVLEGALFRISFAFLRLGLFAQTGRVRVRSPLLPSCETPSEARPEA